MVERHRFNQFLKILAIIKRNFNQAKTYNYFGCLAKADKALHGSFENFAFFKSQINYSLIMAVFDGKKQVFNPNMIQNFDFDGNSLVVLGFDADGLRVP